jgi:hypothetical protein
MSSFREHLVDLRRRPEMFIARYDYFTLAAYIQGCDWGAGGELLKGFSGWVSTRLLGEPGPLHWAGAIREVAHSSPVDRHEAEGASDPAVDLLFDLLLEFSESGAA